MAAILCNGIGSCCELVCTAPCKVCSNGCKGFGTVCSSVCHGLCGSPLSAYVIVTVAIQFPIVVLSAMEFPSLFRGCKGSYWLLGSFLVSIVHIFVAFYLSYRVTNGTDEILRDKHTSYERIKYLLCHDPIVALYILVYLFFVAWLCVGSVWSVHNLMNDNESDYDKIMNYHKCDDDVEQNVGIVLGLGWAFFFLGPTVLSCVLCCVCCSKKDYVATDEEFEAKENRKHQTSGNNNQNNSIENSNSNNIIQNDSYNSNKDADIRNPPQDIESSVQTSKAKAGGGHPSEVEQTHPPRTYSVDGVPIDEVNQIQSNHVRRSSGISSISSVTASATAPMAPTQQQQQHIPEVVAEQILPPAMSPPPQVAKGEEASKITTASVKVKDNNKTSVVDSVAKTFGGWFGGGGGGGGDDGGGGSSNITDNQVAKPDLKATVY